MKLLTLDLGVTTGWALFWADEPADDSWGIDRHGQAHLLDLPARLATLAEEQPDYVVMEKPLLLFPGQLQNQLRTVVTTAEAAFPQHIAIGPAQWKGSPAAGYPLPRGTSQHIRDAVRMGVWWLKSAWDPDTLAT